MKKVYALPAMLFFIGLMLASCSKQSINDEVSPDLTNIININLAPGQSYQFAMSQPGEVNIIKQAKHYSISEVDIEKESSKAIYYYRPVQGYTGTEEIILENKKAVATVYGGCNGTHNNNHDNPSYTTVYTMLRININN